MEPYRFCFCLVHKYLFFWIELVYMSTYFVFSFIKWKQFLLVSCNDFVRLFGFSLECMLCINESKGLRSSPNSIRSKIYFIIIIFLFVFCQGFGNVQLSINIIFISYNFPFPWTSLGEAFLRFINCNIFYLIILLFPRYFFALFLYDFSFLFA